MSELTDAKLALVGSRNFTDYARFVTDVDKWCTAQNIRPTVIISGGAKGADALAERYAAERAIELCVFKADWSKGRSAGPARNTLIVEACTHMYAFPSKTGRGTQDSMRKANAANKPIGHTLVNF